MAITKLFIFLAEHDISQTELSQKSAVDRSTIHRWLNRKTKPTPAYLEAVVGALSEILNRSVSAKEIGY